MYVCTYVHMCVYMYVCIQAMHIGIKTIATSALFDQSVFVDIKHTLYQQHLDQVL